MSNTQMLKFYSSPSNAFANHWGLSL